MLKIYCDRCKKECVKLANGASENRNIILQGEYNKDLCSECLAGLSLYLNGAELKAKEDSHVKR